MLVAAFGAVAAAAGALQYSVSAGDRGISAFLGKEKAVNPFYTTARTTARATQQRAPQSPEDRRAPQPSGSTVVPSTRQPLTEGQTTRRDALYLELDAALDRQDYELAAAIKAKIDEV